MAERKTYVYRLKVTLPPEAADPSWEPRSWLDELPYPAEGGSLEGDEFRWPRNRQFLSASGARHLAGVFRKYGAEVTIERSAPVAWPQDQAATAAGESLSAALEEAQTRLRTASTYEDWHRVGDDLRHALAALAKVLEPHTEAVVEDLKPNPFHYCSRCSGHPAWPCPEVQAITSELLREGSG